MQPARYVKGKPVPLLENLVQMAAGLPDVNKRAKREERQKTEPRLCRPLPANGNPGTPEKIQRSFASEHREHNVIRYRLRLAERVAKCGGARPNLLHRPFPPHPPAPPPLPSSP